MTLSEKFENFEICHATGKGLDMIGLCDIFCTHHVTGYKESWAYDAMQNYLNAKESEIDSDDLAYFTDETLQGYMNEHSPIGCYFGGHKGDATLGYWRILEYDDVGYEYENCDVLPYKESGYPIFCHDDSIGDKLNRIDTFLSNYYEDQYVYTDLEEVIGNMSCVDSSYPENHIKFCEKIIISFVTVLLPNVTHDYMTWGSRNGIYGIYPKLPTMPPGYINEKTKDFIRKSPIYSKLVFIKENREGKKLEDCNNVYDINNLVIKIMSDFHYYGFGSIEYDKNDMADYICDDSDLLNWVIEKIFWLDFKTQVDRLLGSQDITSLFMDVLAHGEGKIDGINEDVYNLRETCIQCKHLEIDYDEIENLECNCLDYHSLNAIWIVSGYTLYNALKKYGAMVYETDSLYLYMQSDFAGTYYDSYIRKAWLTSYAWLGELL